MSVCRAKVALDECCQEVTKSSIKPPTVCISGIDHFQNSVVFAKVQPDDEFEQLIVITRMLLSLVVKLINLVHIYLYCLLLKFYCSFLSLLSLNLYTLLLFTCWCAVKESLICESSRWVCCLFHYALHVMIVEIALLSLHLNFAVF